MMRPARKTDANAAAVSPPTPAALALSSLALAAMVAACAPTIRVKVDPITIYAKLDADVRVRLDQEVQSLIQQNPNLF